MPDTDPARSKKLSLILLIAGLLMLALALTSGLTGLSSGAASSTGPVALGALGAILALSAVAGRRFGDGYRNLALILLNTVVVLILLELLSILVIKVLHPPIYRERTTEEPVEDDPSGLIFPSTSFEAYIMWRSIEFHSGQMTILPGGERFTPGAPEQAGSCQIFMYGGSTMWGWDVPDSSTIPANLQARLNETCPLPVRVRNMAQGGWVSTQSVVDLMLRLRSGDIPDLVVFYDGANEVLSAFTGGVAGEPFAMDKLRAALESTEPGAGAPSGSLFGSLLRATSTFLLFRSLLLPPPPAPALVPDQDRLAARDRDLEALAGSIAATYRGNLAIVRALGESYGFRCHFFWQPVLCVGERPPAGPENEILDSQTPELLELFELAYEHIGEAVRQDPDLTDLSGAFDQITDELYTDICHVGQRGNAIIASLMYEELTTLEKLP